MLSQEPVDLTRLRYVLYARKSTDDNSRQVRSIPDQIRDCQKLADSMGLRVVNIIREKKSAKKPRERTEFTQMLRDLEAKKYDGILCWHPDRLCRNMLEGGEIINMLDEGVLKDIRFHSHQFSNDANGKMLLGMLFVFSKQYSDDLSAKVSRGVQGNFAEGKSSGTPKWGYDREDTTGLYRPNDHFDFIQEAWMRRADGQTLQQILAFLLDSGYQRVTKDKKHRVIKPSINALSKLFRDPFYYGKLIQASQEVDLRGIYDFDAMVDETTFNAVQAIGYGRTQDIGPKKRATFYPLHRFVYCAVCNGPKPMSVGKNRNGSGQHVLSYRCDNSECARKPKSMRAKNVFNSIYAMLEQFELSDAAYDHYSHSIDSMTDSKLIRIKQDIQSRRGALTHIKSELNDRALKIGRIDPDSPTYKINEKHIHELAVQQEELESAIGKLEEKIGNPQRIKLGKSEFLNLVKNASAKLKAGSAVEKDALCRILFLNVRVDSEKVVDYIWREPFASLVKMVELSNGADERT
jgi:site-specific DNA recombinase